MAPRPRANGVDTDASMSDAPEHPHAEEMVVLSINMASLGNLFDVMANPIAGGR